MKILATMCALVFITTITYSQEPPKQCKIPEMPEAFDIKETVASGLLPFLYNLEIRDVEGNSKGFLESRIFRLHSTFHYIDTSGEKIATARARYISWGSHITVHDCNNATLAPIREKKVLSRRLHSLGKEQE